MMRMKMNVMAAMVLAVGIAGGAYADSGRCSSSKAASQASIADVAASAGQFSTLLAAAKAAGLAETLAEKGDFTVFAPTDEAFGALPAGTVEGLLAEPEKLKRVLLHHVVAGRLTAEKVVGLSEVKSLFGQPMAVETKKGVRIGGASVTQADINASNGVIHVIDRVLIPKDIVQVADGAGSFTSLLAAAKAAGLVDTLKGDGPYTVFAPTDDAFAALPEGTVASLLLPENRDKLAAILTYHVVPGRLMAADVVKVDSAKTVQGERLAVTLLKDDNHKLKGVQIDEANVVTADIIAMNGVIHVIDRVMLPTG